MFQRLFQIVLTSFVFSNFQILAKLEKKYLIFVYICIYTLSIMHELPDASPLDPASYSRPGAKLIF